MCLLSLLAWHGWMPKKTALERQDLSRTYLAHHELKSESIILVIIFIIVLIIVTITIVFIIILMAAGLQCKPSVAAFTVVWGGL